VEEETKLISSTGVDNDNVANSDEKSQEANEGSSMSGHQSTGECSAEVNEAIRRKVPLQVSTHEILESCEINKDSSSQTDSNSPDDAASNDKTHLSDKSNTNEHPTSSNEQSTSTEEESVMTRRKIKRLKRAKKLSNPDRKPSVDDESQGNDSDGKKSVDTEVRKKMNENDKRRKQLVRARLHRVAKSIRNKDGERHKVKNKSVRQAVILGSVDERVRPTRACAKKSSSTSISPKTATTTQNNTNSILTRSSSQKQQPSRKKLPGKVPKKKQPITEAMNTTKFLSEIAMEAALQSAEDVSIPSDSDMYDVPQELQEQLLECHKALLSNEQQDDWENHSYYPSQSTEAAAKLFVNTEMMKEIDKMEKEYKAIQKLIRAERRRPQHSSGWLQHKQKQLKVLENDILIKRFEMNVIPLFHPRDSIFGLQSRDTLVGEKLVKSYFVAAKQDNGEKIVKEVTLDWLKTAIHPLVYNYFIMKEDQKGWVVLTDDGPSLFDTPDDDIAGLYENQQIRIYENPEKTVRVHKIKVMVQLPQRSKSKKNRQKTTAELDQLDLSKCSSTWFITTEQDPKYVEVDTSEMKLIMSDATFTSMQEDAYQIAMEECNEKEENGHVDWNSKKYYRLIDMHDIAAANAVSNRGDCNYPQFFYIDLLTHEKYRNNEYTYNATRMQVYRLRYRMEDNIWLGYELKDRKVCVLEEAW
jgi:hypothetical protein